MGFFLRFTLISYASILFFVVGLRFALFRHFDLNLFKLIIIFTAIATPLSLSFLSEPVQNRLFISAIWTSVLVIGFRFGVKIKQNTAKRQNP